MRALVFFVLALALMLGLGHPAMAQDRVALGWGRMFVNDALGEQTDRWRTGSYALSYVRGKSPWSGQLPAALGDIIEVRARGEIISPSNLTRRPPWDRRYAGMLSFGLHSHAARAGWETALGADLVVLGPQTGLSDFQEWIHRGLDLPLPRVAANQLENCILPTLVAEFGRPLPLGDNGTLRPFVETQLGAETFVRVGGDIVIGRMAKGTLLVREPVTGFRYRVADVVAKPALSFVMGADVTRVFSSAFLPKGEAAVANDYRTRLRAGIDWRGERVDMFYGVTWLGKEFKAQPHGQFIGALSLRVRF